MVQTVSETSSPQTFLMLEYWECCVQQFLQLSKTQQNPTITSCREFSRCAEMRKTDLSFSLKLFFHSSHTTYRCEYFCGISLRKDCPNVCSFPCINVYHVSMPLNVAVLKSYKPFQVSQTHLEEKTKMNCKVMILTVCFKHLC